MSDRKYDRQWREVEADVARLVVDDRDYLAEDVIEDRPRAYRQAATNYVRYCMNVNRLGECLDQMVHPQKRATVRALLEATAARLLQVKRELVNQDSSDFNYLDGVLLDMRLTPWDVELKVPSYYRRERAEKIAKHNEEIDRIIYEMENPPPPEEEEKGASEEDGGGSKKETKEEEGTPTKVATVRTKTDPSLINPNWPPRFKKVEMTESQKLFKEAIQLIQRHERARVSRLATQELKEKQRTQHDIAWQIHKPVPEDVLQRSVHLIQRFWCAYAQRHREWHHRTQNRLLMGELTPSWRPSDEEERAKASDEGRRARQRVADEEYEEELAELERRVGRRDEQAMEDIADHLRWYIEDWYRIVGELPAFPKPVEIPEPRELLGFPPDTPAEFLKRHLVVAVPTSAECCPGLPAHLIGGSALIVAGHWIDPHLYELAHNAAQLAKGKKKPGADNKKEKLSKQELKELKEEEKEKKRLEAEAKKKELEEKWKRGVVPMPTELLEPLERRLEESRIEWGEEVEESNPERWHMREDLPQGVLAYERHRELRLVVDDLMRMEIERLQAALNRDRGMKNKGEKNKKNKKGKKGKKGKKDPTQDRTQESLFRELVENGIIKKTPDVRIDSFFCEPSWNSYELRRDPWWKDPAPNLWDVKQVVKAYCVLPLGSAEVHRAAPLVRSVLLAGCGPECGQRALADAVAAEAGAVLFDLSPPATAGKYPGKKGLNMLVHLVTKMSKLLQPSVIFIDGGEKPFYKKVPKPERPLNPKLLKKQLPKMVKAVTTEDLVLFLATSDAPLAGQAKAMSRTYNRIVPVLPPDRSTAARYWHDRLMRYHGVDRDCLYQPLAWCAPGHTLTAIDRAVDAVLVPERIVQLKYRPLDPQELLDELLKEPPYTEEEVEKLVDWHNSTYPLARARAEKIRVDTELREKLAAIEAKKKEQQKKKKKMT